MSKDKKKRQVNGFAIEQGVYSWVSSI